MFKNNLKKIHFSLIKTFKFSTENQRLALLFPGQGCQFVGMLNDYISDKKYKNILDSFDNHLFKHTNFQISQLMSFIKDEPDQEIKRKASILHLTEISQPAILLLSILNFLKLKEENFFTDKQVQYIFGPSLGEIISLVAGESISLDEAGVMLYFRGKFMQESCPKGEGSMLNVIGDIKLTKDLFERFLNTIEDKEYINISSLHSKRLLVLSGKKTLIQKCSQFYKENNIPSKNLNVSAAFHSKLMEEGKNQFEKYLQNVRFKYPKYKLISSVTGNVLEETEDFDKKIKEVLVSQFVSPIRLLECYEICQEGSLKILDVVKRKILDEKEIL